MNHGAARDTAQDDHRFRAATMASATGVAVVDLQGRCIEVNPAFERMFGFNAADIAGRDVSTLAHPDDVERTLGHLRMYGEQAIDAGSCVADLESRYLHRDGRIVWAQASVGVMRDDAGRPLSLIVQLRDITTQHADLEAATRQLDVFASGIAHDLRAPLRAIESYGKLLKKHANARMQAEEQDYLQRLLLASGRMSHLLDGLTQLTRVTTAQLVRAPVDLSMLAEWVLAELQEDEPDRPLEAAVQPDLVVHGDERLLKILMTHLLRNAWLFSRDREAVSIRVEGERDAGGLHLSVHDRGRGIDMRYADKLFQPFQRQHRVELGAGDGLGLAIVQRIAQRHGGRTWAESEVDAGSVFHVWLPDAVARSPHAFDATL